MATMTSDYMPMSLPGAGPRAGGGMGKGYGSVRTEIDRWLAAHSHVILAPRSSKPPMSCYYDAFLALCAVLLWCLASALLGRCSVNDDGRWAARAPR